MNDKFEEYDVVLLQKAIPTDLMVCLYYDFVRAYKSVYNL